MSKEMPLKPRMSEKSYAQSHSDNVYTFDVPLSTNKIEIARAVEAQFEVSVQQVRVSVLKGKSARSIRIGGTRKNVSGKRVNVKKAYITVKAGDTIPIFASIDEAEKKQEKLEAKLAKKAKKEPK
jgi:large subunit ribosomal protein L23